MSEKGLSLTQRRIIDRFVSLLSIEDTQGISNGEIIRLLRKRFFMTQTQLAKRSGLPQSFISKLERGVQKPSLTALKKLFSIFDCSLVVIPIANKDFDAVLEKQAKKYARKIIDYVNGTMSLENQLPDDKFLEALLEEETKKLLFLENSKIWDIP